MTLTLFVRPVSGRVRYILGFHLGGSAAKIVRGLASAAAALVSFLLVVSPVYAQGGANDVQTPVEIPQAVRFSVAPKAMAAISMKVLPKGSCTLRSEGASDAAHSLKLFAEDDGTVRFQVRPSAESDESARFQIDCQAGGQMSTFPLELRPNASPTDDMPAPSREIPPANLGGHVRPALTVQEAMQMVPEDLIEQEYPPRPDPQKMPGAFATWLKAVTKPATFVPARLVANPGVRHVFQPVSGGLSTSGNWSGFELHGPAQTFNTVFGDWYVPAIALGEANVATYSAFWIGLDGDGTNDLVQDGTEQNLQELCFFFGCFDFTSYYAWSEFLPQQPTEQIVAGFTVSPGDEMYSNLSMCTFSGPFCFGVYNGTNAAFLLEDITRSEYTLFYTPRGSTHVGGSEAEWIMERPGINNSLPDLANYVFAIMSDAYACNDGFPDSANCMNFNSPQAGTTGKEIWMYNGSDLLSWVVPITSTEMEFFWSNWH
jgi:hypothetical protein